MPPPDEQTKQDIRRARAWKTPVPEYVRENPKTAMALVFSILVTGGGAGFINRLFPPEMAEAKAESQSDQQIPLILYRLEQIEKRLEKVEKRR